MYYTPYVDVINQTSFDMENVILFHIWPTGNIAEVFNFGTVAPGQAAPSQPAKSGPGGYDYWTLIFSRESVFLLMPTTIVQAGKGDSWKVIRFIVQPDYDVAIINPMGEDAASQLIKLATSGLLSQGDTGSPVAASLQSEQTTPPTSA